MNGLGVRCAQERAQSEKKGGRTILRLRMSLSGGLTGIGRRPEPR
jgi:hypothetical protein